MTPWTLGWGRAVTRTLDSLHVGRFLVRQPVDVVEVDDSYVDGVEPKFGWRFSMKAAIDSWASGRRLAVAITSVA